MHFVRHASLFCSAGMATLMTCVAAVPGIWPWCTRYQPTPQRRAAGLPLGAYVVLARAKWVKWAKWLEPSVAAALARTLRNAHQLPHALSMGSADPLQHL